MFRGGAGPLYVKPNVRAKREPTVGRQARTGENVHRTRGSGPGGLPLALRLSEASLVAVDACSMVLKVRTGKRMD